MAISTLIKEAQESGTYTINMRFYDEEENLITPYNLTWTLLKFDGSIVNERDGISAIAQNGILNITLSGNDLIPGWLYFSINGVYDSTYGIELPLTDSVKFYVRDLIDE